MKDKSYCILGAFSRYSYDTTYESYLWAFRLERKGLYVYNPIGESRGVTDWQCYNISAIPSKIEYTRRVLLCRSLETMERLMAGDGDHMCCDGCGFVRQTRGFRREIACPVCGSTMTYRPADSKLSGVLLPTSYSYEKIPDAAEAFKIRAPDTRLQCAYLLQHRCNIYIATNMALPVNNLVLSALGTEYNALLEEAEELMK